MLLTDEGPAGQRHQGAQVAKTGRKDQPVPRPVREAAAPEAADETQLHVNRWTGVETIRKGESGSASFRDHANNSAAFLSLLL